MDGRTTSSAEPHEPWLDHIYAGMDVCDNHGEKIGVVVQVHRHSRAANEAWFVAEWQACPLPSEIIEVEAEALASSLRLYLPVDAIGKATESALFLDESRTVLEREGYHDWDTKPVCSLSLCPLFGPGS